MIIELPCAIYELLVPSGADDGMHLKAARSGLAVMRIVYAVLLVVAAPFLSKESTRRRAISTGQRAEEPQHLGSLEMESRVRAQGGRSFNSLCCGGSRWASLEPVRCAQSGL